MTRIHSRALAAIVAVVVLAALLVVGRSVNGLPGDEIPVEAAVGYALWMFLISIAAGLAWVQENVGPVIDLAQLSLGKEPGE